MTMVADKSEIRISGEESVKDQSQTKMLNPKLKTTSNIESTKRRPCNLLNYRIWICLGFSPASRGIRVQGLDYFELIRTGCFARASSIEPLERKLSRKGRVYNRLGRSRIRALSTDKGIISLLILNG